MLDGLRVRLRALFHRDTVERELDDEYRFHLERLVERNLAAGMSPEAARLEARRSFGDVEQSKEESRDARGVRFVEEIVLDVRYGLRTFRKSPGFALVAILSLTLGIGANTAIFQLLDAVRLRLLPVDRPTELVEVTIQNHDRLSGRFLSWHPSMSNPLWEEIRDRQQVFSGAFAFCDTSFNLAPSGEAHFARGLYVSGEFFSVLGVRPHAGRLLAPADDRRGEALVAVLSYAFWQREYGGSPSVIGRTISLEGHPFEVVGVAAPGFFGVEPGRTFDVAVPLATEAVVAGEESALDMRDAWWLTIMGRLASGVTAQQATEQLDTAAPGILEATLPQRYDQETAQRYRAAHLEALPSATGISELRDSYERPLWFLLAIAGFVLAIACANLANLLLARASAHEREIAVRLALGASRGRLVRQFLTESLLLAVAGAGLGLVMARFLSQALVSFLDANGSAVFVDLGMDWRVFGFAAGLGVATCVIFGVAPALYATKTTPGATLKASGRALTQQRDRLRLRRALVASQVALSLVLVVCALLFARTLANLLAVDTGLDQSKIVVAQIDMTRLDLPAERRAAFKREMVETIRAIPTVDNAAHAEIVPLSNGSWNGEIWMDGSDKPSKKLTFFNRVGPHYFSTMGVAVLAGRDVDDRDTADSPKVAVVNEEFARRFAPDVNPIGRRFWIDSGGSGEIDTEYEIVGLVSDSKYLDLRETTQSTVYLAAGQDPDPNLFDQIVIRAKSAPKDMLPLVRSALDAVDSRIVYRLDLLDTDVRGSLVRERLMATLSGFFGVVALALATIGLYGVTAYSVSRRTHEIGIRMALGALRRDIAKSVLVDVGAILVVGLIVGLVAALGAARAAGALLFGVAPTDAGTLVAAAATLGVVTLLAALVPARRAASVDPMSALRDE